MIELATPTPAIRRSSAPMVPPPIVSRQSDNWLGNGRGVGENAIITSWSSTKLMPIVASSGAMRTEFCKGRRPKRSISKPTIADTAATSAIVTGSGVCRCDTATQPT